MLESQHHVSGTCSVGQLASEICRPPLYCIFKLQIFLRVCSDTWKIFFLDSGYYKTFCWPWNGEILNVEPWPWLASRLSFWVGVIHRQREHINPNTLLPPLMSDLLLVRERSVHAGLWQHSLWYWCNRQSDMVSYMYWPNMFRISSPHHDINSSGGLFSRIVCVCTYSCCMMHQAYNKHSIAHVS